MKALTILATHTGLVILTATSALDAATRSPGGEPAAATQDVAAQGHASDVQLEDGAPALRRALGLDDRAGALVLRLDPNADLAHRGLRAGDLLVAIDGQPVDSAATARVRLAVTEAPRVTLVRAGRRLDLDA